MRIPSSTYRLQFHKDFDFVKAASIIDYLHDLGISDVYASPIFKARAGSTHGYDVVDPNQINPELGTTEDFNRVADAVKQHGMGWLQDIVPNHMAYDGANVMLMDVLENGRSSAYADFFDIDWDYPMESMRGKVLAPCLGEFYGACLENGELVLKYDAEGLAVHYYQQRFPLNLESYSQVFAPNIRALRQKLGRQHADLIKLLGVLYTLKNLPSSEEARERADQIIFVKSMLWELYSSNDEIRAFVDDNVARFNGTPGKPDSFNTLDELLAQQYYRLSFWKVATEEINYRRFFNINELISVRVEDPRVFDATQALALKLVRSGTITGLRVDHIDGLYDPATYLTRIREQAGDVYVVVEKILETEEALPQGWLVSGTTGYDFTNFVNGVLCQPDSEKKLTTLYTRFTGIDDPFPKLVNDKKRLIIGRHMAGDVDRLAHLLKRVSSRDRYGGDITLYGLKRALVEVLTYFPVYRSYVTPDSYSVEDRALIGGMLNRAKAANPALRYELEFIEKFLLLEIRGKLSDDEKTHWIHFIMRLQQLTGPLMAKGFEDTTLYIYNRLISLNEVGGNPGKFGVSIEEFHRFNQQRLAHWPHTMSATSTHDIKRGEDARARIDAISEIADDWDAHVRQWHRINRPFKRRVGEQEIPTRNDEYFYYQSLLGALPLTDVDWPGFTARIKDYLIKAVREAKVHTEWLKPDDTYEQAFLDFVDKTLDPKIGHLFLSEFLPFARRLANIGAYNSWSQTLLKLTAPGVPDFYQGTELWDLSFVDPDNRRPVDFAQRRALLAELRQREARDLPGLLRDLQSDWQDGRLKFYLTYKTLNFRRAHASLFNEGDYLPIKATGKLRNNLVAFARNDNNQQVMVIVPRFVSTLYGQNFSVKPERWADTAIHLPDKAITGWGNIFTGETLTVEQSNGQRQLRLAQALREFPVALLQSVS